MKQFDPIIIEYFTANSGIVNRRGYDMTASKKRQVLKLDNQQCVIVAKILSRFISKLQDSTTLVSFFEPKLKQKKNDFSQRYLDTFYSITDRAISNLNLSNT